MSIRGNIGEELYYAVLRRVWIDYGYTDKNGKLLKPLPDSNSFIHNEAERRLVSVLNSVADTLLHSDECKCILCQKKK